MLTKSEIQQEASGEQWEFITTLNHRIDDLIRENDTTKENFESINERSKHFFNRFSQMPLWNVFVAEKRFHQHVVFMSQ